MVGRFRLEHVLGNSADGRYSAVAPDGARVTIELVDVGDDPRARVEQMKSDPAFSQHEGEHVAKVLDYGVEPRSGRVFVALPAWDAIDARTLVAGQGPLDPEVAVRIILQACRGVQELQAAGAHLPEVRASDLWLAKESGDQITVRVAPVSSARPTPGELEGLTGTDVVLLRSFVAPERRQTPASQDERSTVWSLGACLYWLLGGSSPGTESSVTGNVTSIQDVAPWVTPGLTIALHLALQADPNQRWPSVEAFADAIEPYAAGDEELHSTWLKAISRDARRRIAERADPKALGTPPDEQTSSASEEASSTGLFGKAQNEPARLETLVGHNLGGRWQMLSVIGRGGMGAVFEVVGPDGTHAAAKVIDRHHIGEDEEHYKRFFREAQSASLIDSPHVVRTIEAGVDEDIKAPFIIMELMRGVDLKRVLRERGALTVEPTLRLFAQAAKGIAAAHHQQIIHRDIKPANLFLHQEADGTITVKVCDFGIAKRASDGDGDSTGSHDLTRTGSMLGSPLYMSPEQASNARKVDRRTDIWSLCISLYEALSGTKPWAGRSALGEIIVAICTQPVPPLTRAAPWIDRQLAAIVHHGLSPELGRRYANVDELIEALKPFMGDSDQFKLEDLAPVPPELRSMKPSSIPPADAGTEIATVMGGSGNTNTDERTLPAQSQVQPPSRKLPIALGILVVAVIAVAGAAILRTQSRRVKVMNLTVSAAPIAQSTTLSATPAPTSHAQVKIEPPDARVTVDGHAVEVDHGHITLSGPPGTAYDVVATLKNGQKKAENVVLAREGGAIPSSVVVETKPVQPAGAHYRHTHKPAAAAPPKNHPQPPPKPTAKPTSQPQFKSEW